MVDHHQEFMELFLSHQADIKAFIRAVVRNRDAADDVFQEVGLILWKAFDRFDRERSFGRWAKGIARNKILQLREKVRRDWVVLSPEAIEAFQRAHDDTEPDSPEMKKALRRCVEKLPEKSRRMITWRYHLGLQLGEIGRRLGKSLDAANKALGRVRDGLEKCVEREVKAMAGGANER